MSTKPFESLHGGCAPLKGVQAYKNGHFDEAIADFQRAKDLDPSLTNARLYLATAYASMYVPGAPSEENLHDSEQAIDEFKGILEKDPNNLSAIDGIGSIFYAVGSTPPFDPEKLGESKSYHKKHIEIQPNDPEPHYWVGVIDWALTYRANMKLRDEYNEGADPRSSNRIPCLPISPRNSNATMATPSPREFRNSRRRLN
jgi:tetratricopeptide (TPR) repeat protein